MVGQDELGPLNDLSIRTSEVCRIHDTSHGVTTLYERELESVCGMKK